jgi:hypothetical protein
MTTQREPAHIFGHLGTAANGTPLVLIPEPDPAQEGGRDDCFGIAPGWHDVPALLRQFAGNPDHAYPV